MKRSSPEERNAELKKAKQSTKTWTLRCRNWDYVQLSKIIPHNPSRWALVHYLRENEFFVANAPMSEDMEEPSTSGVNRTVTSDMVTESAMACNDHPATESHSDSEESNGGSSDDSTRQE